MVLDHVGRTLGEQKGPKNRIFRVRSLLTCYMPPQPKKGQKWTKKGLKKKPKTSERDGFGTQKHVLLKYFHIWSQNMDQRWWSGKGWKFRYFLTLIFWPVKISKSLERPAHREARGLKWIENGYISAQQHQYLTKLCQMQVLWRSTCPQNLGQYGAA